MKTLYSLEFPSTGLNPEPHWEKNSIFMEFNENEKQIPVEIKFVRIFAIRTRSEICCTTYHIKNAYDKLVEIDDSDWVSEILLDTQESWKNKITPHHYMIYLDSVGCFEVLAQGCEVYKQNNIFLRIALQ